MDPRQCQTMYKLGVLNRKEVSLLQARTCRVHFLAAMAFRLWISGMTHVTCHPERFMIGLRMWEKSFPHSLAGNPRVRPLHAAASCQLNHAGLEGGQAALPTNATSDDPHTLHLVAGPHQYPGPHKPMNGLLYRRRG